jgi:nitrate reductase beta subunit
MMSQRCRSAVTSGAVVDGVLKRLAAMRSYMRDLNLGRDPDGSIPAKVGMTEEQMHDMYRLLALAKYDERYVIPPAHAEQAHSLEALGTECPVGSGPFGEGSGAPVPIAVENFAMLRDRQMSDTVAAPVDKASRVNLLNWDGKGIPSGMFPAREGTPAGGEASTPDTSDDGATGPGGTGGLTGGADYR